MKTKETKTNINAILKLVGIPDCVPEFEFDPTRKWRFDYAWPGRRVALEVDGGAWTGGRHVRGRGFIEDQRKCNAATLAGWAVYRVTPAGLKDGSAFNLLQKVFRGE